MSSRPTTPGGAFEGGIVPPTSTTALENFIYSKGDTRYAARLVTIDGVTKTVSEWLTTLSLETGGVGDNIAPTVVSGTVDGSTVTVVFSEAVQAANTAGLTVEINNVAVSVTDISGNGTDTLTLTLATAAVYGNAVTFNYDPTAVQPGQGLRDLVGNVLGMVQDFGLTNLTVPVAPYTLDFEANTYDGASVSDLSVTRSSSGYHPGTSGVYWEFGPNTLRRTNLGLLIEPAATNLHANPTLTGGTAGNLATTGVLPSPLNFGGTDNGLATCTFVGRGTEDTTGSNLPYMDLDITATGADTIYINWTGTQEIAATSGQVVSQSFFVKILSGTWPASSTIRPTINERTSAGAVIASTTTVNPLTPSTSMQRATATRTLTSGTAAYALCWFGILLGGAITGTVRLRVYIPNIVKSATITSPIKGTGSSSVAPTVTSLPKPSGTVLLSEYVEATHKNDTPIWHGDQRWVLDAAWQPHNLTSTDNNVVRFESRTNEIYNDPGVYTDESTSIRNQMQTTNTHPISEDEYHAFDFMVEAGSTNTASWFVFFSQRGIGYGQDWSAPFEIGLRGERFVVTANYETGNGTTSRTLVYRDAYLATSNLVRGAWNRFEFYLKHGWNGTGTLKVRLNGVEIVNLGPTARIGYAQQTAYNNKFGIYKQNRPETIAISFRNQSWVYGSGAAAAYSASQTAGSMTRAADVLTPTGDLAAKINAATLLQVDTGSGLTTVTKPALATIWNGSNTLLKKLVITP